MILMIGMLLSSAQSVQADLQNAPEFAVFAERAIASADGNAIQTRFHSLRWVQDLREPASHPLDGMTAVAELEGCVLSGAKPFMRQYTLDYKCPSRAPSHGSCQTADRQVMVSDQSFVLVNEWDASCPPPAPPAPPLAAIVKLQSQIISQLLKAGLSGDELAFSQKVRPDAKIFFGERPVQRKRLSVGLLKKLIENCNYDGKMEGDGETVTIPMICNGTEKRTLTFFFLHFAVTSVASSNAIIPEEYGGSNG